MAEAAEGHNALGATLLAARFNTSQRSGTLVVCCLRWGEVVRKTGFRIGVCGCELFRGKTVGVAEVHPLQMGTGEVCLAQVRPV